MSRIASICSIWKWVSGSFSKLAASLFDKMVAGSFHLLGFFINNGHEPLLKPSVEDCSWLQCIFVFSYSFYSWLRHPDGWWFSNCAPLHQYVCWGCDSFLLRPHIARYRKQPLFPNKLWWEHSKSRYMLVSKGKLIFFLLCTVLALSVVRRSQYLMIILEWN